MTAIGLKGGKDLAAFLDAFPVRLQKNAVRAALTAAARPIRDQARANAPHESGKLAKAIRTGNPKVNQDGTVSVSIRLKGEHAFLGLFMEFGVAPHLIARTEAGQGKVAIRKAAEGNGVVATRAMKIGDEFVSGIIHHPGFGDKPFLRPALDAKAGDAIKAFGERMRGYLKGKTGFTAPAVIEADEE